MPGSEKSPVSGSEMPTTIGSSAGRRRRRRRRTRAERENHGRAQGRGPSCAICLVRHPRTLLCTGVRKRLRKRFRTLSCGLCHWQGSVGRSMFRELTDAQAWPEVAARRRRRARRRVARDRLPRARRTRRSERGGGEPGPADIPGAGLRGQPVRPHARRRRQLHGGPGGAPGRRPVLLRDRRRGHRDRRRAGAAGADLPLRARPEPRAARRSGTSSPSGSASSSWPVPATATPAPRPRPRPSCPPSSARAAGWR